MYYVSARFSGAAGATQFGEAVCPASPAGLVVVGGGVARSGEQLLGPARAWVLEHAMGPAGRSVDVVRAALGDQVGVVGAAAIVFDRAQSRG
jgi:predicted NBD/HSP70 family sugar kinase